MRSLERLSRRDLFMAKLKLDITLPYSRSKERSNKPLKRRSNNFKVRLPA